MDNDPPDSKENTQLDYDQHVGKPVIPVITIIASVIIAVIFISFCVTLVIG
jgi:hypothetical protein